VVDEQWNNEVSDWYEAETNDGKNHLNEWIGAKSDCTKQNQLRELARCKQMDFALGNSSQIMCWRIGLLFCDQQQQPLDHFIASQRREGHVEKKTVQNRGRNPAQRIRQ